MTGISGSLLSLDLLRTHANQLANGTTALRAALSNAMRTIGPSSAARQVLDGLAIPLVQALGFELTLVHDAALEVRGTLHKHGAASAHLTVGGWGADLARLMRMDSASRIDHLRWTIIINGAELRIADRLRAYSRRALDFDLQRIEHDDASLRVLAGLLEADRGGQLSNLERCSIQSDVHRVEVGESLQLGVERALSHLIAALVPRRRRNSAALDAALGEALTIVYRILFLLFAEARGLVPQWHPVYRNSYTIESLRTRIERDRKPPGVWSALQAISRLAHRGCRAGTLRVIPFNGRLFAPTSAPLAESLRIDDARIRNVLIEMTTRLARDRRERISYADLGVEQLGAVYERVLDYAPTVAEDDIVLARSGLRKATGTFYTPRAITEYLVRRTLAPLVRDRSPEDILQLRVVDPAMGSGAFLVAVCRYLADAYEHALVREGTAVAGELTAADRAGFRRTIAQRCLYGVDRNPTAVQLARLSLWLCTLAADRPLTFLDHHLRTGNSLVGAAPHDVMRQPPGTSRRGDPARSNVLPLFEEQDLPSRISSLVVPRTQMDSEADDTAEVVRRKDRTLASLEAPGGPIEPWRSLADAWCSAWFWPSDATPLTGSSWGALAALVRGKASALPSAVEAEWRAAVERLSARERFFHWELEFPEVFFDRVGEPLAESGFDAVLGNPPWDTLRESSDTPGAGRELRSLARFSRESGCYRLQQNGHGNLYQLFTERALQLVRPGGRIGLLLPSGLFSDHGCAALRRELFNSCEVDAVVSFENREAVFPIHRGVRFALLTARGSGSTDRFQTKGLLRSAGSLEEIPDEGVIPGSVVLSVSFIGKLNGAGLAVPHLYSERDREIVRQILSAAPALGSQDGWACRFGRELNASDDRAHFTASASGLPVLEGKLLDRFRVNIGGARNRIPRSTARRLLADRCFERPRLGYREVAASTNRRTLIAAMIPPDVVTTHTVFCLKGNVDDELQWFLCGVLNGFVANYLIRLHGGTHVTAAMMGCLPVPKPSRDTFSFKRIAELARALSSSLDVARLSSASGRPATPFDIDAHAELEARAARLYRLDPSQVAHILATFPLVPTPERTSVAAALTRLGDAV